MRARAVMMPLVALAFSLAGGELFAQEDLGQKLGLQIRRAVEHGKARPALLLTPRVGVKSLRVTLKPDHGKPRTLTATRLKAGRLTTLDFDSPEGEVSWEAFVDGVWAKGGKFSFGFTFETASLAPLEILLRKKDVDLERSTLEMRLSRAADKVEYVVKGDGGKELDRGEMSVASAGRGPITLRWHAGGAVIEKITLRASDSHGFWGGMELTPFTVYIPHSEVEFESGEARIRPSEAPKLAATLGDLKAALDKHGHEIEIQLYIAGYTDTVGKPSDNTELSLRRARSIAAWFRSKGVSIPIYYQGFGEKVLAVSTPDETAEPRNRRALYVLSAGAPAVSSALPLAHWKLLR